MDGSAIVTAARDRFFNRAQAWTYAPQSLGAYDGSVTITQTTRSGTTKTGPAIDCSHFVMETMLAAGYDVSEVTSGQMGSIARGGSSSLYSAVATADIQPGNVVAFTGHVGIVTSYDPDTGIGTYDGAQSSSTGLAQNVLFTTKPGTPPQSMTNPLTGEPGYLYSGTVSERFVGATQPNAAAYNPAGAARKLESINGHIDQGLIDRGIGPYFSSARTNGPAVPGGDVSGGGERSYSYPLQQIEKRMADLAGDAKTSLMAIAAARTSHAQGRGVEFLRFQSSQRLDADGSEAARWNTRFDSLQAWYGQEEERRGEFSTRVVALQKTLEDIRAGGATHFELGEDIDKMSPGAFCTRVEAGSEAFGQAMRQDAGETVGASASRPGAAAAGGRAPEDYLWGG